MSVSEIQSWKSSRVSESDRVPANKIKEWNMFLEMTNTHKKLQAKNITEIFSNNIDSKKMYRLGWNHYSRLRRRVSL